MTVYEAATKTLFNKDPEPRYQAAAQGAQGVVSMGRGSVLVPQAYLADNGENLYDRLPGATRTRTHAHAHGHRRRHRHRAQGTGTGRLRVAVRAEALPHPLGSAMGALWVCRGPRRAPCQRMPRLLPYARAW